jgi:hypothetical protein
MRARNFFWVPLETIALLALPVIGLFSYMAHEYSMVILRVGVNQPIGAIDRGAIQALLDPQPEDPSLSTLRASGRLFDLAPGTKARVLTRERHGSGESALIKIVDGSRAGQRAWVSSDNIQREFAVVP